jgi:ribosome biogenesis GTPase
LKGIVIKTTGSQYFVESDNQKFICRIKGTFKIKDINTTNPLAVGDIVQFDMNDDGTGLIHTIEDRKNYIIRKSVKLSRQSQILASNLDAAALVVTPAFPKTSTGFIDRFIATAEAYHIPAFLIFNKADLFEAGSNKAIMHEMIGIYEPLNYKCLITSVTQNQGIKELKNNLADKVTLIAGHSGVGKTSLLNVLDEELKLKTNAISQQHLKGVHTTTFAEMFKIEAGGYIIDTPGIGEFGTFDFVKEEISHYFREMLPLIHACKFNNCLHEFESSCAVKKAVEQGSIHPSRYYNYLSILRNEDIFR